jgi:HSP20 family protein
MIARTLFSRTAWEDPLTGAVKIQKEMNRLLDALVTRRRGGVRPSKATWAPPVDVYDAGDGLVVHAELPGVRQEEIQIAIQDNILTIRGERKADLHVRGESYHRRERLTGPFHRALSLPSVVDTARVKAVYREGVLEIRLPKREEAQPRTIRVEAA